MCILFFWCVPPHPFLNLCVSAMSTQLHRKYFYLHFKMPNSKQLGLCNHSALVTLNIIERESWRAMRDSVKRDRTSERASMCLRKRVTEHDRGWSQGAGEATLVQFVFMQLPPCNVLQTLAIFPDKLVASSAIGDLPLFVEAANIPRTERVNQKSGLQR